MATSIKIDDALKDRVRKYVEREEAKESFKQDAISSWEDYHANGRHLTSTEVHSWLDKWGTEADEEHPPCHD